MANIFQIAYGAYRNRQTLKKVFIWLVIVFSIFLTALYVIVATVLSVLQGGVKVGTSEAVRPAPLFTQFQQFSYTTINGGKMYDFVHPYIFPTLGVLTQGVLASGAVVGQRHIAWDIADRINRETEVKAFADGTVVAVKNNVLKNTTRRWKLCNKNDSGICWYAVTQTKDVQFGCGYEVIVQHADSLRTQYCHLADTPSLKVGDPVAAGETIGIQGNTGFSTGKHLHFALWRDGQSIDPSYAFSQTSLAE